MRKVLRTSAVLLVAGLAVPLWAVPSALAETSSEPAAIGAYFYSAGIDKPEESPTQPPNLTGDNTDGVAPEHLAVAVRLPGQIDKKSFLSFDLSSVPFDATITKAVVTVPLAENGNGNTVMSPAAAKVRACAAGDSGFNGEDGASFAVAPEEKCDVFAAPAVDSADKKAYTFDVSALAASWQTDLNTGMALTVAEGATSSPFQVVFLPFANSSIALEFTAPPEELETFVPEESFDSGSTDELDFDSGFSGGSDSFDDSSFGGGSFDSGSAPAPDFGGFDSSDSPAVDGGVPAPDVLDEPVVAGPSSPGLVQVARSLPSEVLDPSFGFFLGALLSVALLALLSLIMGDPRLPAAAAATAQTRLSKALQQREQAGSARSLRTLGA